MTNTRTTNMLLAVIAVCLFCLTVKTLIPEARAQGSQFPGNTYVSGCYNSGDSCVPVKLRVDSDGTVVTRAR